MPRATPGGRSTAVLQTPGAIYCHAQLVDGPESSLTGGLGAEEVVRESWPRRMVAWDFPEHLFSPGPTYPLHTTMTC